ncbi:MAG: MFS transporter [Phycisphaerales bacterium]|nr:MAG: MFS transporter [Phycisphaerales bacterium]
MSEDATGSIDLTPASMSTAAPTGVACPPTAATVLDGASASLARVVAPLSLVLFLTMLPVTMIVLVLKELKETFNAGTFWSHAFMSVNMIAAVLAAPVGAAVADRLSRRKPVLLAALALNAATLLVMGLLCARQPVLWVLMIARFVEGAAHIVVVTSVMALAGDWAPSARRGRVMGLVGGSLMFGTACGAVIGGRIAGAAADRVFHLGAAIIVVAGLLAAGWVRDAGAQRCGTTLRDTLNLIARSRRLLVPYAYAFIDRLCVGVVVSTLILYLSEIVNLTPAERGAMLAMFLVPFALLCYPAGRLADRWGRALPMGFGSLAFGLVFSAYGLVPHAWLWSVMLASGVLSAIMFAPNLTMCADLAPPEHRAAAFAGFNVAGSLGFLVGPLLAGGICTLLEPRLGTDRAYTITFIITGAAEVLCALVTLPWLLRLHRAARSAPR